jgi:hypothetical protein
MEADLRHVNAKEKGQEGMVGSRELCLTTIDDSLYYLQIVSAFRLVSRS